MDTQDTQNPTQGYLLLIRGTNWDKGLSPEDLQNIMGKFMGWVEGMRTSGKLKDAHPLALEGKLVSGARGKVVSDGPFAESKEAIGGYFFLEVPTLDEAVALAQACPALEFGAQIEVRPIGHVCPAQQMVNDRLAEAAAR